MLLELHIWGPAFGLPSIEPQSLATVAYLIQCLPRPEWRLIASSDPFVGPSNELPALKDSSTWIYGFHGIVNFLREHSSGKWDLDQNLGQQQRADSIAFSSFLESRGPPLLDLSLYVSSENYKEWTRPALAQILEWPQQWIVPHRLRDEAKIRSEHLGLSSLDIENTNKEDGGTNVRGAGNIPKNLVAKPKETVAGMLGKSGHQNQFRLDAVTSDFFEPLCDLVEKNGSHSWVFGTEQASSLDCLLLGYISLMSPPLTPPRRWLPNALFRKHQVLLQWMTNFRQECFGGPISMAETLSVSMSNMPVSHLDLPWHPRAPVSARSVGLTVVTAAFDSLPIVSWYHSDRIVRTSHQGAKTPINETARIGPSKKHPLYSGLGVVGSALGAAIAYCFYVGLFGARKGPQQVHGRWNTTDQRDFGEAGRMLGLG